MSEAQQSNPPRAARSRAARIEDVAVAILLFLVSTLVVYPILRDSLSWRYFHDTPILMYIAFLMDHYGFVPYRDIFDMNMLGSYLSYQAIGRLFGFQYPGVRMGTLVVLGLIMGATALALRRFGWRSVWAVLLVFPLVYMRQGNGMTLQREYLGLLPIMLGVCAATAAPRVPAQWRALAAGCCFGLAATIKPHLAIGLVPVVWYLAEEDSGEGSGWRVRGMALVWNGLAAALGMALPLLGLVGYLVYHGVLGNFLDSALGYLPLYGEIMGDRQVLAEGARLRHLMNNIPRMGEHWEIIAMGLAGLGAATGNARWDTGTRRVVSLLWMLLIAYVIYPAFSGQFWSYHYLPMMFFCSVGAGLAFASHDLGACWQQRIVPMAMVFFILCAILEPHRGFAPMYENKATAPEAARIDGISEFLKKNLRPGDTVQPLDWAAGGMCHAMLQAEARIATPFVYYFHFFHHPHTPYIQALRRRFVRALEEARPRYILQAIPAGGHYMKPGPRTTTRFTEVERILKEDYVERVRKGAYIIHERKDAGGQDHDAS